MKENDEIGLLIDHFLQNSCSAEEVPEIIRILQQPCFNPQLRAILSGKWQEQSDKNPELSEEERKEIRQVLSDIHHKINLSEEKWRFRSGFRRAADILIKMAAILFIPLMLLSVWLYYSTRNPYPENDTFITIDTPAGSKIKTELPDGTMIWQNSGSTIKYPKNFTRRNRQVFLSGEAYFDVKSDKLHPFTVLTSTHQIKVTGTQFNVSAYENDGNFTVALVSGKILARKQGSGQAAEHTLIPGDCLVSTPGYEDFIKHHVDLDKYVSWIDGKLIFRDDPLEKILKKLGRWYNVEIEIDDPHNRFKDLPFTLTIKDESFPQIMEYIKHAAPLVIKEERMTLQSDGSFNKQKYIIQYRKKPTKL